MPYADSEGIRIYYQIEGNGPPLVLHYGFGGFLEQWYDNGYVDALKDDYRLVLMDPRGCGASDKPHDRKAYRLEARVEAGPGPMQKVLRQGPDAWLAFLKAALGRRWQPQWEAHILASDVDALGAMAARWEAQDPDDVLPSLTVPCLIFAGERDDAHPGAKEASEIIPDATFVSLPGLDHLEAGRRTDLVLPHMRRFLAELDQRPTSIPQGHPHPECIADPWPEDIRQVVGCYRQAKGGDGRGNRLRFTNLPDWIVHSQGREGQSCVQGDSD